MLGKNAITFGAYFELLPSITAHYPAPIKQMIKRLLHRYKLYIERRKLTHVHVDFRWSDGPLIFMRRQIASVLMLLLGTLLAIPSVPGPGWACFAFALFIGHYPGKARFIAWVRNKKYFRYARVLLRKNFKILLIMPK